MAKITEHLISLIRKQVDDHGIVVWYDPELQGSNLYRLTENSKFGLFSPGDPTYFRGSSALPKEKIDILGQPVYS